MAEVKEQEADRAVRSESPCQILAELVRQYFDDHPDLINSDRTAMQIQIALTRYERMSVRSFLPGDRVLITNSSGGLVEGSIVEKCPLVPNGWRVRYKHGGGDVIDSFPDYRLIVPAIPAVLEGDRQ